MSQDPSQVGDFIHEMTHVYQYQQGDWVMLDSIGLHLMSWVTFGLYNSYNYTFTPGNSFSSYNVEAQGEIARAIYYGNLPNIVSGH